MLDLPAGPWLALDTSQGLVAGLVEGRGRVLASFTSDRPRGQTEEIARVLEGLFSGLTITPADLVGVVVGRGPGAFTGLRVGIGAARVLARALGLRLVGVGSHTAIACGEQNSFGLSSILVTTPAGRKEFYWSRYAAAGGLRLLAGPGLIAQEEVLALGREGLRLSGPVTVAGLVVASQMEENLSNTDPLYLRPARVSVSDLDLGRIEFLPAGPEHLVDLVRLEKLAFGQDAWSTGILMAELSSRVSSYWVMMHSGQILGYGGISTSSYPAGNQAEVQNVAVDPGYWGRGLGARLLEKLLHRAHELDCKRIMLEVRIDNLRAQKLYKRFGFEVVSRRPGYYRGVDGLVMSRSLPL